MRTMVLVYLPHHNWVILFGQMLGFIFQHHGSHMGWGPKTDLKIGWFLCRHLGVTTEKKPGGNNDENIHLPSGYVKIAIENGYWSWIFPWIAWCFSIVMLIYQRVIQELVGGDWNVWIMTFHSVGNGIIPTDELIFFGRSTTNQWIG